MTRDIQWYGWIPDLPDARDFKPSYKIHQAVDLPPIVDLRPSLKGLPIYDQGPLGSCTSQAIATAHVAAQFKNKYRLSMFPSRLFIYYNERAMEGSIPYDSGAAIRDGIKSIVKQGVCDENIWPYNVRKFAARPSTTCYKQALSHQAILYERLDNAHLNQLLSCLAEGLPFVFGFSVYESFESNEVARTGVYAPSPIRESVVGGHACLAVSYDIPKQVFTIRNSWGDWGMAGHFTMKFSDVVNTDMCTDFWRVNLVE